MALIIVSLQVLYLLASCAAINTSCSADQCKLLPSAPDVSTEFQSLASEKNVRIVYLHLKVGNSSYRPLDLENVFFPERWVWANSISEPMLSMQYNYDILSLSLLNNQARSINVHLIEEPSGCLANLNSSCHNAVVGKVLLENVTRKSSGKTLQSASVVCVAMITKGNHFSLVMSGNIKYHCCEANKRRKIRSEPPMFCDLSVKRSDWSKAFDYVLLIVAIIIGLYCPAFPLLLPEAIVMNIMEEIKKEENDALKEQETQEERSHSSDSSTQTVSQDEASVSSGMTLGDRLLIPVDDTSPITCSVLLQNCASKLPGFQLSFNVKLVFLLYFVVPFFFYIFFFLSLTLKDYHMKEALRKDKALDLRETNIIISISCFLVNFIIVASLKPKDLIKDTTMVVVEPLGCETTKRTVGLDIHLNLLILHCKVRQSLSSASKLYVNGLKKFIDFTILKFLKQAKYSVRASRKRRLLYVSCVLILSLLGVLYGVVLGGFFLAIFLVKDVAFPAIYLSPLLSVYLFLFRKLHNQLRRHLCSPCDICVFIMALIISNIAIFSICFVVTISCYLIVKVIGYTLMGLILNVEIATPYAVFLLTVVTNVYFCYANLQNRYKEVKEIISQEWEKNKGLLQDQRHLANEIDATIPRELFWFVCGEDINGEYGILPIQTEMFYMFRNMFCVVTFLFLSLSSVIIFGNSYQISTVVTSIALFISGVIPKLFLQGFTKERKFVGWEKIKITREIEKAVQTYIGYVNNGGRPEPIPEQLALANVWL